MREHPSGVKSEHVPEGEFQRCSDVLFEIRQHARLGRLRTWGDSRPLPALEVFQIIHRAFRPEIGRYSDSGMSVWVPTGQTSRQPSSDVSLMLELSRAF